MLLYEGENNMIETIDLVYTGYSSQSPFWTMKGGRLAWQRYPATVVVLQHETRGTIIIDTGYGAKMSDYIPKLNYQIYQKLFGANLYASHVGSYLAKREINYCFLSHFHPDHIGGFNEISDQVEHVYCSAKIEQLRTSSAWEQQRISFFPKLLPQQLHMTYIESCFRVPLFANIVGLSSGYDLLGDRSIIAFPISGHAIGQFGFMLRTTRGVVCYAADACWHSETIFEQRYPHPITKFLSNDYDQLIADTQMLYQLAKQEQIPIVLCHCVKSHQFLQQQKGRDFVQITCKTS